MQPETKEELVFCPNCKAQNPEDNRFCGKCGTPLPQRPSLVGTPKPGNELPKELIEFDKKIPLIAQPGSDRRNNVPADIREQAHEVIERDRMREMETQKFSFPPPVRDAREDKTVQMPSSFLGVDMTKENAKRESFLPPAEPPKKNAPRTTNSFLGLDEPHAPVVDATKRETVVQPVIDAKTNTPSKPATGFLNLDYQPMPKGSVNGPSFLGLSDTEGAEEEEIEESHTRRNIALLILLVLIALGATQWREIRDNALPFVKNGTEYVKLKVKGQQSAPAPAPEPNANANGTPNIEVAPTNQNLNQQQAQQTPPATDANANPATPADGTTVPANGTDAAASSTAATAQSTTAAQKTPPAATDDATDATTPTEEAAVAKPAKKAAAKPRKPSAQERPQIPTEEPQAGEAELQQAAAMADPAAQADMYWKAVKKGNPEASVRLAEMYILGKGVSKNCEQATVLLRSASAHNYARARGKLGAMYATGQCVTQDRVQAYQWMSSALEANPSSTWTAQYRDTLWNQMTPAERMRAKR